MVRGYFEYCTLLMDNILGSPILTTKKVLRVPRCDQGLHAHTWSFHH